MYSMHALLKKKQKKRKPPAGNWWLSICLHKNKLKGDSMYNSHALNNFVLNVFQNSNDITITEEEILKNSISRLDALIPTGLKVALKKVSEKTETTMKEHLVKALMMYLEGFDISNIDADVITVRKSEYEKLKKENKELKKENKKLKMSNEKINKINEYIEELKKENKELKKENKKLNAKVITLQNKLNKELKKDIGAYILNEIENKNIKEYNDIIKVLGLYNSDDIIKFNNKIFETGYEEVDDNYKIWRFKDSRLKNYVLVGECRDESIIVKNDETTIKNIINNMKLEKQKQEEIEKIIYGAKVRINIKLYELADKFPDYRFEILKHRIPDSINDIEELKRKVDEINKWMINQFGFPVLDIDIDI